jgi:hypothetical protein
LKEGLKIKKELRVRKSFRGQPYLPWNPTNALLSLKDRHPKNHKGLISLFGLQFVVPGSI